MQKEMRETVEFQVDYETRFGQNLYVMGSTRELGMERRPKACRGMERVYPPDDVDEGPCLDSNLAVG